MTPASSSRLILVSNRLPLKLEQDPDSGEWRSRRTLGGLATGLGVPHAESGGLWIGWPGIMTEDGDLPEAAQAVCREHGYLGLGLTDDEHERYYLRASNRCIWPLLHGFVERVEFDREDWKVYRAVNQRFADAVVEAARPGDTVFVQDFQLALVPAMIRAARADLRIGFFLHVPFPHTGIFRALPSRAEMLKGLLGADVIGFHTLEYLRCFRSAARRVLGVETTSHAVQHHGRQTELMARPLGIETSSWERPDSDPELAAAVTELRAAAGDRKVLLGVERLDYTKGILERLLAFREMLEADPSLVESVVFFQIAVPSRVDVEAYKDLKEDVERLVGEINSRFGRVGLQPLHYQFRGVDPTRLTALYRIADVCVVTPLRDGLNLVAKEFVASRTSDTGVLVLSEFTGAAWELTEALHVNPYDLDAMKDAFLRALAMDKEEQAERMSAMRHRVRRDDVHSWTREMIGAIQSTVRSSPPKPVDSQVTAEMGRSWDAASDRVLALDYDGTLRELQVDPLSATPAPELIEVLTQLAASPGVELWIVSGRTSEFLSAQLGDTGAGLIAEHGRLIRAHGAADFVPAAATPPGNWKDRVRPYLESVTGRVQGSHVEEKAEGLAWHYRGADPESAAWQAHELYQHLGEILSDENLEVMRGNKVLEIRPSGVSKASALAAVILERGHQPDFFLIAGDDVTDESMFRAFPDAMTILVGERASAAHHRVDAPADFRALLTSLSARTPATSS